MAAKKKAAVAKMKTGKSLWSKAKAVKNNIKAMNFVKMVHENIENEELLESLNKGKDIKIQLKK